MKKLLLGTLLLLSTISFAQINTNDLIGYWEPDKHATQLVFWKDVNKNLQIVEFSTVDGALLTLLSMKLIDEKLVVKTVFKETNWKIESTYTFIDDKTLKCVVTGDGHGILIYTKKK